MKKQYAVVGNPVLHSLSPLIHQRAFDYYGIEARYFAYEVQDFSAFMEFFRSGSGDFVPYSYMAEGKSLYGGERVLTPYAAKDAAFPLQGLSVTIPHKKSVLAAADVVSYRAKLSGAANTLYWQDGRLTAENTDIAGFYAPLEAYVKNNRPFKSALVYGAGGAACAVLTALLHMRELESIYVCARRREQAEELIAHFSAHADILTEKGLNAEAKMRYVPLPHEEFACDLAVNTIPQWKEDDASPRSDFSGVRYAYDLTYKNTPFLRQAAKFGCFCQDGKAMFVGQAKAQFNLWTGLEMPPSCYEDLFA